MTYKDKEVQPEFFCPAGKAQKPNIFSDTFFQKNYPSSFTLPFDTLVVVIITGLMVSLACFALGIEHGKRIALKSAQQRVVAADEDNVPEPPEAEKITAVPAAPASAPLAVTQPEIPEQETVTAAVAGKGYVIQLVTYSSDTSANEEIQRLKANGVDGLIVKSGKYFVVCAGLFDSKTTAVHKLGNFKKRYKDCFVRFLEKT